MVHPMEKGPITCPRTTRVPKGESNKGPPTRKGVSKHTWQKQSGVSNNCRKEGEGKIAEMDKNLSMVYKGSRGRKIKGKRYKRGGQDRTQEGNKVEEQQEATGEPYTQVSYKVPVRYHCGGRPMEINACFLNSYMVYL
jgi:hypothetical protein